MPLLTTSRVNTGESADASDLNTPLGQIETVVNALDSQNWASGKIFDLTKVTNTSAATGDLIRFDGTNWARFQPPACRAGRTTSQAIPAASTAAIQLDAADSFDTTGSMHDPTTNNTRITIPTAGIYMIVGKLVWQNDASARTRAAIIRVNGTTSHLAMSIQNSSGGDPTGIETVEILPLNATDYVELLAQNNNGTSAQNVLTAALAVTWSSHV